ncbi:MAG: bifunctional folylpolyglutamate synthase/dihydrofolate synthase [Syntrophorhabdaceae bacterium]|nr:bifunctional folylpolyglutamate synthase/dihydrofolate synthase [Syntrophorhabdaceae bacterium]MDD4195480.1 bifunctional folylpolyglutamate synthase/dihydrofolate synthase [Syntrophorhabdaceae bacterium]HOC45678.1 folylpolyglutamate synthase/dihydrofolate synthase family protein [Syntrophorhabdaceae bacterium]
MNDPGYEDSLKYIHGLERFGSVFGLDNISRLLGSIDDPHRAFRSVHIAGTNGKGSVATMIACILKEAGYSVGKYTSPHLVSFTERITVNEEEITEEEVAALTDHIRGRADRKCPGGFYTFFDFTTAMAFEYFRRKKVDIAVVETGLGGRLDSTNVIEPLVSIVTNVAFDHMKELGGTLTKIAGEKAGIIKKGVPVITGAGRRPFRVIEKVAGENASAVYALGRDFSFKKSGRKCMSYRGLTRVLNDITINLNGDHQLSNAALALCAVDVISGLGYDVPEDRMRAALSSVVWQGRLEMVREKPLVILDGAHNASGVRALRRFLRTHYRDRRKVLVFGVMRDKQYRRMLESMSDCIDLAILTQPRTDRALDAAAMKTVTRNSVVTTDTRSALKQARRFAGDKDLILVTGSFYTIGEAKQAINEIF